MTTYYTSAGFTNEEVHVYLATGLRRGRAARDGRGRAHRGRPLAARGPRRRHRRLRRRQDPHRAPPAAPRRAPERRVAPGGRRGAAAKNPRVTATTDPPALEPGGDMSTRILDFLAYLEFERGLSRNTLEAYRSDLLQLGEHLRRRGVDPAAATHEDLASFLTDLAEGQRRPPAGRARDAAAQDRLPAVLLPPPAPRGGHRARPDVRPARPAPEPAAAPGPHAATRSPGCSRTPKGTTPAALRDRALLELMYACGLRASEAIDLEVGDLDLRGRGAARPRQGQQGAPRARRPRGDRRRARVPRARPPGARRAARRAPPLPQPARQRPDPPGALQDRPAPRRAARARRPHEPAHAAPHVRHAPARGRLRSAVAAGDARARRHRDDADLHAPLGRAAEGRVLRARIRARGGCAHAARPSSAGISRGHAPRLRGRDRRLRRR